MCFVEFEGTAVATFSLALDDDHWGPQKPIAGYVHGLSVRKSFSGRGLGNIMIDWCASKMTGLNRRFIRLDFAVQNAKLCAHYESLGFIRVGLYPEPEGERWYPVAVPKIGESGARAPFGEPFDHHAKAARVVIPVRA
ncbi:GNAT family N-acetyltransferase [Paraburkholderia sp. BCC1886]|uniref:GNAT family N-acetyltransferase n=1 Tax=Paraburkholderia sp. BCC1886 TaxID=2562670 RepID=UPI0021B1D348|nr:GNAT family N-acetyltransferase [Paraburkholderia sp. BCC1886]